MSTSSQSQSLASLSASVTSLQSSLSLLDSSIRILDSGISDFPRLKKVLSSTRVRLHFHSPFPCLKNPYFSPLADLEQIRRYDFALGFSSLTVRLSQHFELTPSSSLATAQASLASELAPAIQTLLTKSELYIAKIERRQQALIARSELLEGRLESGTAGKEIKKQRSLDRLVRGVRPGIGGGGGAEEKALRLKALRQKKERLGYAVERLTLQSQQRQRQLRMSIAATPDVNEP